MRFWDSSGAVPLLIDEPATAEIQRLYADDPTVAAWWGAELERISALARRERGGEIEPGALQAALARLDELRRARLEIEPGESVRRAAKRLLRVHDLRVGCSVQLAAALVAADGRTETLDLLTLDERLAAAARREGFRVLPT